MPNFYFQPWILAWASSILKAKDVIFQPGFWICYLPSLKEYVFFNNLFNLLCTPTIWYEKSSIYEILK